MITLLPDVVHDGTSRGADSGVEINKEIKELEDLHNLIQYANSRAEAALLSAKMRPRTIEQIEGLEHRINEVLVDLSSYKSKGEKQDEIQSDDGIFRIRDLMITILPGRMAEGCDDPCSYTCEHGDSIPCPAGVESLAPPPPPPPPPPPEPSPQPSHSLASQSPELVELKALLEHALARLGGEESLKLGTPKKIGDLSLLELKLKAALERLTVLKGELKSK